MKKLLILLGIAMSCPVAHAALLGGVGSGSGSGSSGGASTLAVTIGVQRSSPTSDVIFNPNQFTGSVTASTMTVNFAPQIGSILTSNTAITANSSVVLASCTATGTSNTPIVVTLPDAVSSLGTAPITIYDVGNDSCSVQIKGAGTDLIVGTGTFQLNAKYAYASLQSLGSVGWGAAPGGLSVTPWSIFTTQDDVSTFLVAASSQVTMCPIYVPTPIAFTGFRINRGTAAGNNNSVAAIFDQNNKFIVQVATMVMTGGGVNYLSGTVTQIPPGWYKVAYTAANTLMAITGSNAVNSTKLFCGLAGTSTSGMDLSTFVPSSPLTANGNAYPAIDLLVNGGSQGL